MATLANTIGQFVKYEAPQNYSRENVTVVAGQNLAVVNGTKTALGELIAAVDASPLLPRARAITAGARPAAAAAR